MREARLLLLVAGFLGAVALLALGSGGTAAGGAGKYNSMTQMKTVEPCTAQTTLEKTSDKADPPAVGAVAGDTITYTVTETNDADGSCLLDANSDGTPEALRVTGTFTLENRSGAGSGLASNNACNPADPRTTCVLNVLDWVETHTPGAGNSWNVLNDTDCVGLGCGLETTISGNQLDGKRNVDAYCPSHDASANDSRGPIPDLDGDGAPGGGNTLPIDKCSPATQSRYGTLVTSLASPQPLPCGQPGGASCFGAPQVYTYTLSVDITPTQAAMLANADGIRNVAHFDMFNEQLTSSGRNHFTRASFTHASLSSNAYNVTITDTPRQAPGDGDSCTFKIPGFASAQNCAASPPSWIAGGAGYTLAAGQSGTATVQYKVRDDDCEEVITNVATATHTDVTAAIVSTGEWASADTRVQDCPRLTVNKELIPGGDTQKFNLQIDETTYAADVGNGGSTDQVKMTIGDHTAGEIIGTGPRTLDDYSTAIGDDCDADGSVTLGPGTVGQRDEKTCTITNTATRLTVEKVVVPAGDNGKFNLQIDCPGTACVEALNQGNGGSTGVVVVSAGAHTVGEAAGTGTELDDYVTTIGGDCASDGTINLAAGDSKTCTITNVKKGEIKIIKDAVPDSSDGFDFSCSGGLGDFTLVDDGSESGNAKLFPRVVPGSYTCTETVPETWGLTAISCDDGASDTPSTWDVGTGTASIEVDPGETVTCTFTDAQGKIKIVKDSQPDDARDFHFTGSGNLGAFDLDDDSDTTLSNTQVINRGPGTYTVTESGPPAPWALTSITCDDGNSNGSGNTATIVLDDSEEVTCTFTNSAAKLTVKKVTVPASDTGIFNLRIDGDTKATGGNGASTGGVLVSIGSPPHTVSETAAGSTVLANYDTTIDCGAGPVPGTSTNVSLASGEEKTCTITNTRKPTLTVNKALSPTDDPGKFNLQIDGATAGTGGNVGNGGTTGAVVVDIGTRTVGETAVLPTKLDDYTTTIGGACAADGSITLGAGENKTCTITNTRKVVTAWNAHSQGHWRSDPGHASLDADGDSYLDSPPRPAGGVCIGIGYHGGTLRGKCITTIGYSDTILDGVGGTNDQKASCSLVVGNENCTPLDAAPKDAVSRADLAKLMGHTLALEYNIIWLNGGATTAKISDMTEPACTDGTISASLTKLGLTTSSTVGAVRIRANGLINNSPSGGVVTTSSEMTAMIQVLGNCVNTNHAVVPGDRDWDGVPEDVDVCPGIYNPDQSDVDGDGIGDDCDTEMDNDSRGVTVGGQPVFRDDAEAYMGTDSRRDCGLDAWGPDFNGDWTVDIFDVGAVKATFASAAGDGVYAARNDLSTDGYINVVDLAVMKRFWSQTCVGVDPIQPGAP